MRAIASKLKRKLHKGDAQERCGLILNNDVVFQTKNVHPNPDVAFMFDPQDLLEYEPMLVGTWHTHPGQSAALSQADYDGFSQWPQLTHYIIGTDGVRAYRSIDGFIQEVDVAAD